MPVWQVSELHAAPEFAVLSLFLKPASLQTALTASSLLRLAQVGQQSLSSIIFV
jgi:hypothetical protein